MISKWLYLQQEYQGDNTNKITVSQDFGGNKYSKNIRGLSEWDKYNKNFKDLGGVRTF